MHTGHPSQVSKHQSRIAALQADLSSCESELVRQKETAAGLKAEIADLQRQQELKKQEVLAIKKETSTQLK